MKKIILFLFSLALIIGIKTDVKADEINYNLLLEWSKQPIEIQYNLARDNTQITVVDEIPYQTYLADTWATTSMYCLGNSRYVYLTEILIKKGHETSLTHEVGHALSNYQRYRYFWADNDIWDMCYLTEARNQIIYPQGWDDKYEYFACCYQEYLTFPEYMRKIQPSSFNYMKVVFSYQ